MASIQLQGDNSGSLTIQAPSDAGNNTLTLPATSQTLATQNALGVRNLIINGDMRIDQRNAGSATTYNINNNYTLDRWKGSGFTTDSTIQQVTDAPSSFSHSMKYTVVSAVTPQAVNTEVIAQGIEGQNVSHLNWGSSTAKSLTMSFWVKSSLTGTFCISISNSSNPRAIATASRSYVTTYTIDSANTWEKKTITIAGDTSGTWVTNNGSGIAIQFPFAVGSNYSTSNINTWQSGTYAWITGTQYITETASATWQITGVQLEVGDTATPFEHRPYDMELARCQRYYEHSYNIGVTPGTATFNGAITTFPAAYAVYFPIQFKVNKRAIPTIKGYSPSTGTLNYYNFNNTTDVALTGSLSIGHYGATPFTGATPGNVSAYLHFTAEAEL